ncbi:hypothetical protein SFMTTN_1954 [Sulfuriferula multivorans]|uniref:Uncharacterized protein n=1 Tax=Sulfuriferula multivorans TaxID=1559896 RepID=A0A401JET6_9PROT|nr:hypothetical protein SFMTTN_1954 [Sulfuriferula multivorans]
MNAHPSCLAQNTPRLFRLYTRSINRMEEDKKSRTMVRLFTS